MLINLSDEERKELHKRRQLIFMLKRHNNHMPLSFLDAIEDMVFSMTEDVFEENYLFYKDIIDKEIWVDCHPLYFHLSEFDQTLKDQLSTINSHDTNEYIEQKKNIIFDFYKRLSKSNVEELTLEEKLELFWMTHPNIY
ncbi:MAG TPA: hypothetical protein PLP48_05735 [Acholeplasmataceae bacterium]|nr:hypothetical protein [Acholeplasmataceae bacterium]